MLLAFVLDLATIYGGLLLALPLLARLPVIGYDLARHSAGLGRFGFWVGVAAVVAGGYFLLMHLFSGPHVFHFEVVGIAVGVLLMWERLTGRRLIVSREPHEQATGGALLLAIFGLIAVVVGVQGLFTPN